MQKQQQLSSCPPTYHTLGRCPQSGSSACQMPGRNSDVVYACFRCTAGGISSLSAGRIKGYSLSIFGDDIIAWENLASPLFCCLSIFTTKTTSFTSYVYDCNKCQNLSAESSVKHTLHIDCFRHSAVASNFGNLQELTLLQISFEELVLSSQFSLDSKMWLTSIPLQRGTALLQCVRAACLDLWSTQPLEGKTHIHSAYRKLERASFPFSRQLNTR